MILTSRIETNADLIADVAKLYLKPRARIADVTYGRGNFWSAMPKCPKILASDIAGGKGVAKYDETFLCLFRRVFRHAG